MILFLAQVVAKLSRAALFACLGAVSPDLDTAFVLTFEKEFSVNCIELLCDCCAVDCIALTVGGCSGNSRRIRLFPRGTVRCRVRTRMARLKWPGRRAA